MPLEEVHFPSVQLNVAVVQEKHIYEQQLQLEAPREQHKLQVVVTSDKDCYEPGERATYTVTTRDYQGKPVSAELALGVVDASIYAIRPDNAPNVVDFFYGEQEVRVETNFSFAAQYSGGAYQTVPARSVRGTEFGLRTKEEGIRIRRLFADTAYWNPFVVTDESGTAQVTFNLPDNLTTWRATARGITLDTVVGSATRDVVATMPLLVRLELPRFYVRNDEAIVSAVVHNYTNETRAVRARIEATGATLQGESQRTLQLVGGGQQGLDWNARITDAARVRFIVVADCGLGAQDAMELTLPVHLDGLKMVEATATSLDENNTTHRLNVADMPRGAICQIALSPSIASAMFDALDYLTSYPYGCAEQTMSSFLPDVIVAQTLRRLNVQPNPNFPIPQFPNLDQWVNLGLQKLYRYQHGDGGWNWWEFDQTDGDMTAYVLWGLIQALDTHAQASLCLDWGKWGNGRERQGTMGNDGTDCRRKRSFGRWQLRWVHYVEFADRPHLRSCSRCL